jgi:RNA polymerase sigma factor (sigma-70 family)
MEQRNEHIDDTILINQLTTIKEAEGAITYLYQNYYGLLAQFILSNNGNEQDAQDIFQEVIIAFVHLVRQGKFRGESSIKTFLYALNRNLWFNELKRRSRSIARIIRYDVENKKENGIITTVIESREATQQLLTIIKELGDNCRQILLLYYYENQSMKEIVQKTGYENEQVVRNKKYKCLKKLEEKMTTNPTLYQALKNLLYG